MHARCARTALADAVRRLTLAACAAALALLATVLPAAADLRESAQAVVGVRVEVPPEARTVATLGSQRAGSGVVLDRSGLVLTIGYLILEAGGIEVSAQDGKVLPADVVAYDHESGFGLVRTIQPLSMPPVPLGSSAEVKPGDPLLVLSYVQRLGGLPVTVTDRRGFAGYWEYAIDDAIFTSPAYREFGGAALLDPAGRLVGVGSLIVQDAAGPTLPSPGNMFVPIDALKPIFADMLAFGKRDGAARPWLGLSAHPTPDGLRVLRVAEDGPAEKAGVAAGDVVLSVAGEPVGDLAALWHKVWGLGPAGTTVPLEVRRGDSTRRLKLTSIDRSRWLKWRLSF